MSWAEEQDWFGLEDLALEALYDSDYDLGSAHSDVESISIPAWRMADDNLIAIRDMETSHIKNCIKMIERIGKLNNNLNKILYMGTHKKYKLMM